MHKKTSFQYLTRRELLQSVAAVGVTSLGGAAFGAPSKPYYPRGAIPASGLARTL